VMKNPAASIQHAEFRMQTHSDPSATAHSEFCIQVAGFFSNLLD
jgi:hypothetical protein